MLSGRASLAIVPFIHCVRLHLARTIFWHRIRPRFECMCTCSNMSPSSSHFCPPVPFAPPQIYVFRHCVTQPPRFGCIRLSIEGFRLYAFMRCGRGSEAENVVSFELCEIDCSDPGFLSHSVQVTQSSVGSYVDRL